MRKLSYIIIALLVGLLSACGGSHTKQISSGKVKYNTVGSGTSDDTVLWVNSDGSDCDLGDWLEGDKDCKKHKKTVYYSTPKKTVTSSLQKSHHITVTKPIAKTNKPVTVKKPVVKTKPIVKPRSFSKPKTSYSKPRTSYSKTKSYRSGKRK